MSLSSAAPIKALILDMDGVLWRGDRPIGDLPAIFTSLKKRGYGVVLATNNATLSVADYLAKIRGFGVDLEEWQIVNSSQAAGHYLAQRFPEKGKVFIIGESGLVSTLSSFGFELAEREVLAVVAGMDRDLTYDKLRKATLLIRGGALFIGTNPDRTYPMPEGLVPGAGAILAAIEAATDTPPIVVGKPAPEMYRVALERLQVEPEQALVVGDRLETDIAGAQKLGCRTALVLSGVTSKMDAHNWSPPPDWIEADLTELMRRI